MCFSNLPVEFDDEGNPYLAEEADEVDATPGATAAGCGCSDGAGEVGLDEADPEATYEAILESMPGDVRERVAGTEEPLADGDSQRDRADSAESD
jgi:hypothetical protein